MAVIIEFWHWWAAALLLLIIELLSGTLFFLSLAAAAVVTGIVMALLPGLSLEVQVSIFSLVAIASLYGWVRLWRRRSLWKSDRPLLNRRVAQFIGRVVTLEEPIVNGEGRIRLQDTVWKVRGEDTPAGRRVEVIGAEGVVLRVAPLPKD